MALSADAKRRLAVAVTSQAVADELVAAIEAAAAALGTPGVAGASQNVVTNATNDIAGLRNIAFTGLLNESAIDGIVAHAGGGQALATPLVNEVNRVITVATGGDSVLLPPSSAGLSILVVNHGANAMQVFGAGTDTVNDVATATGVSQMANSLVLFTCATAGSWYSEGLATGFAGNLPTVSYTNAITAFATGGQASAVPLTTVINRITTVGTAGDSVKLPAAAPGLMLVVTNAAAANSMNLFPNTGDAINAGAANAAFAIVAGKTVSLSCAVAGIWHAVLSA